MGAFIDFVVANKVVLLACLLAISECLALIPSWKANSIAQAVFGAIKWLYDQFGKPKAA